MRVGEFCNRGVATAELDESVQDVAMTMRQHQVREVVVVDRDGGRRCPLGVLTDRTIVIELLALGIDAARTSVGQVMERDLHQLHEEEDLLEALESLRMTGRSRLAVVNGLGDLVGLLTRDDVLAFLCDRLTGLASLAGEAEKGLRPECEVVGGRSAGHRFPMD